MTRAREFIKGIAKETPAFEVNCVGIAATTKKAIQFIVPWGQQRQSALTAFPVIHRPYWWSQRWMKDGKEYGATNSGPHSLPRLSKQSFEVQQGSDQRTLQIQDLILFFASPSNYLMSKKAPIRERYKFGPHSRP